MRHCKSPRGTSDRNLTGEEDRDFHDFLASVSATKEELAALTSVSEPSSLYEVKTHLQEGKQESAKKMDPTAVVSEFQRRFQKGWEGVAAAFAASEGSGFYHSSPRKTK